MKMKLYKLVLLGFSLCNATALAQITPWEMVEKMGKGLNLGNTLEAPEEGDWSAPATEYYFHDFVDAGFTCVRIPIRWTNHMLDTTPFTVDSAWMNRVEEVIDWALDTGLVVIINSHHDNDWLYDEFPKNMDRFEALWEQISQRFKDKSENLVFEIVNEPYFDLSRAEVDTLHKAIFPIIRESNPTRIVLFTGGGNDTEPRMTNYRIFYHLNMPDDPYVMAYFHYYVPYQYCQLGNGTWGSVQEKQQMVHDFTVAKEWSDTNDVPILLGEFAVTRKAHRPSLVKWYEHLSRTADEFGFAQTTWCTGGKENMATYFRNQKYWDQELVNIQTRQHPYSGNIPGMPGIIQAEDFDRGGEQVAYKSADSTNSLGYYRPDEGIDIDSVGDSNYAIFISEEGEWLEYVMFIDTASLYEVNMDVSSLEEGNTIQAQFNGAINTELLSVTQVSNKHEFATVKDTVYLEAGVQVIRVFGASSNVYVDQIGLSKVAVVEDTSNLLDNPDFEIGIVGWSGKSSAIEPVEAPVQSGTTAILVSDRKAHWASIQQDILDVLKENGPGYYTTSAFMQAVVDTVVSGKVTIKITSGGESNYLGVSFPLAPGEWTQLSNQVLIDWTGSITEAFFYIETLSPYTGDFYCDNTLLRLDSALTPTALELMRELSPSGFSLSQNYPNPCIHRTSIQFSVGQPGSYELVVYDLTGKELLRVIDSELQKGAYKVNVEASNLASGTYIYRLKGSGVNLTRKMILMK